MLGWRKRGADTMKVERITKKAADVFVKSKHYSRRPSIFWDGFGLLIDGAIEGIVVYGQPSPSIQKHSFRNRDFKLYELARLVIQTDARNAASMLIGSSLKMLDRPSAVVSYADSLYSHCGIVYQATNWIYTGSTKSHDHLYLIDGELIHPMTLRDRGITNPMKWSRDNGIKTVAPMPKHRYFFLNGSKSDRKRMLDSLQYPVITPYPKCDQNRYDDGDRITMGIEGLKPNQLSLITGDHQ